MSLIKIDSTHSETETRFIAMGFDIGALQIVSVESQYIQSYKGKDVARFKVYEPKNKRVRLYKTPLDHLRHIWA